jgi:NAD(P)-dependent dehydrogenase (short-subunit alcohol dehydrogenase family)
VDGDELSLAQKLVKSKATESDQMVVAEVIDVSNSALMEAFAEQVFEATKKCHVLFNNAGIGVGGPASSTPIHVVDKVIKVNTYGPIHGCLAFIPRMRDSGEPGIIINTGSKQGITCPPGNLTYNMSKAALKVYTEGLEHELMLERLDGRSKIRAVLLIPGCTCLCASAITKTFR